MNAVELTRDLVRIDTVNPQSAERPAAERLGQLLIEAGYSVATHEFAAGRASLVARREGPGLPICFAGHLDTVPLGAAPWTRDPFGGELDGGKLYGRGSSDMKSGVAAMSRRPCDWRRRLCTRRGSRWCWSQAKRPAAREQRTSQRCRGRWVTPARW